MRDLRSPNRIGFYQWLFALVPTTAVARDCIVATRIQMPATTTGTLSCSDGKEGADRTQIGTRNLQEELAVGRYR